MLREASEILKATTTTEFSGISSHAYDGTFGECRSLLQGIFVDIKRQLAFEHDSQADKPAP